MFGFRNKNVLDVMTLGNPILAQKSQKIEKVDDDIMTLAEKMVKTMYTFDGVGLAAPQVGHGIKMVILGLAMPDVEESKQNLLTISPGEVQLLPKMPLVLVNPEILAFKGAEEPFEEGCLSVPEIYANVMRPSSITFRTQFLDGTSLTTECAGYLARVIQHELDHLDGILFVDRLDADEKKRVASQVEKLKKSGEKKGFIRRK